jgi:hypothetical protein
LLRPGLGSRDVIVHDHHYLARATWRAPRRREPETMVTSTHSAARSRQRTAPAS